MRGAKILVAAVIAVVALIVILSVFSRRQNVRDGNEPLLVYCAAGVKQPVSELIEKFSKEYGFAVQLQYGGSGTLLSNLEVSRKGDLFIAADRSYADIAKEKKLIEETLPIALMRPVIAVAKGNPKGINDIAALTRNDLRIALGNPESASIGKLTKKLLAKAGSWESVKQNVEKNGVFKPTVPDVANDVIIGAADASVVWDATVAQSPELEAVRVPEFDAAVQEVTVCVLASCKQPVNALRLARWLNSNIGNEQFKKHGFETVQGDEWAWHPEITFYCGAVNQRSVDDVIKAFAEREGITINTIYNGCGILTGQMRTIRQDRSGTGFPDVYMACDRYYLDNVKDWFQEDVDISDTEIVIAVSRGNPKNIKTVEDLAQSGMRVSVGQPEQCTIGALSKLLLEECGLYAPVMSNVVMQTASSAMLVPSVITRSVDATLAYITDTKAEAGKIDIIPIPVARAKAIQPFSIAKSSRYKYLGRRLFAKLAASGEQFEKAGFHFRLD